MNAWQIESSEYIVRSPWIGLRADRCRLPNGAAIEPVYVIESADFVHAVAITPDDCVLLSRQYRHAIGRTTLELPGGFLDATDETPLAAAQRELREETGYAGGDWQPLVTLAPNSARFANNCHVFLALGVTSAGSQRLDSSEQIALVQMPLQNILPAIERGEFDQAQEIAALMLALRKLGRLC